MEEKRDFIKEFTEIYTSKINREGADKLLDWLLKSDFTTCPASTKFHSNHEGGLIEHSVKAYKRFVRNLVKEYGENWQDHISEESAAIIGLLHDICKVGYYKQEMRNVKEDGIWVQKPYYIVDDKLPYGHGEKSVYIISGFMKLTREEAMAINWHMGGFDARVQGGSYSISGAFYEFPVALIFHLSDLEATYLDEQISN